MKVVRWIPTLPANELSWTVRMTKKPYVPTCYPIQAKIEGIGPTGLPTDPTFCA